VPSVIAFDSKEFNVKGVLKDFFCPIGIGVRFRDEADFNRDYCKAAAASASRHRIRMNRQVFDSYTLARVLGGLDSAADFYLGLIEELGPHIEYIHFFYTMIPPSRVPRIFVYEIQSEAQDPVDFLREHKAGYVALCAWKYSQIVIEGERADRVYLDFFEAKRTRAWDALESLHPHLFIRGDTCNPCLAMADGILSVMDRQLKRNYYMDGIKLGDRSVRQALRDLSLKGEPVFIGQPDLRKIVPYSRDQVITSDLIRRPVFFLCPEKRPDGVENQQHREMIGFMPVMDKLVGEALRVDGCIKFYDQSQDFLIARKDDRFAFFGDRGREICQSLLRHVAVIPLDLSDTQGPPE
jgi:hypothetical protein